MRFIFSLFVLSTVMDIGGSMIGTTEAAGHSIAGWSTTEAAGGKSTKKKNNQPQQQTKEEAQLLFLQAGTDCAITQSDSGMYRFRATVGKVKIYFSERPDRLAGTMATQAFVNQFDDTLFVTSNPNGAITFTGTTASAENNNEETILTTGLPDAETDLFVGTSNEINPFYRNKEPTTKRNEDKSDFFFDTEPTTAPSSSNNTGPLIVELSQPRMVSSSIIEYTLMQSDSQGEVASIDQFLEMSNGISCSIFIDSAHAIKLGVVSVQFLEMPDGN